MPKAEVQQGKVIVLVAILLDDLAGDQAFWKLERIPALGLNWRTIIIASLVR
jgi:hypothetical protein